MTSPGSAASVRVERLTHTYPAAKEAALRQVSLEVQPGARLGLLGPNGAGKSTLMRILCGYLPLSGDGGATVQVDGYDVRQDPLSVRTRVGYMPEHVPLYPELRVSEHLRFRASIKRVPRKARAAEVERVAELTGLSDRLGQPISQLSRGYRQRVGIADALLGSPGLLVLDEPTVGLDPNQVLEIRSMLKELGGEQTLIFSSHILAEVEALCDRVAILSMGELVVDATLAEALSAGYIEGRFAGDSKHIESMLGALRTAVNEPDLKADIESRGDEAFVRIEIPASHQEDPEHLMRSIGRVALQQGVSLHRLELSKTRLEERFAEVTGATRQR